MLIRQASLFVAGAMLLALAGCNRGENAPAASIEAPEVATTAETVTHTGPVVGPKVERPKPQVDLFPEVVIKTTLGAIRVRLNAEKAPVTVDNFLANYARRGFYNGTLVHYVDSGKMLIAGGFTADLQPKEARAPILNEANNKLSNKRGTIAMVRDAEYAQSATSQFFINLVDNADLDHVSTESGADYGYCVFGEVIEGMEVVDAIAKTPVHDQGDFVSTPVEPVVIESVEQVK